MRKIGGGQRKERNVFMRFLFYSNIDESIS